MTELHRQVSKIGSSCPNGSGPHLVRNTFYNNWLLITPNFPYGFATKWINVKRLGAPTETSPRSNVLLDTVLHKIYHSFIKIANRIKFAWCTSTGTQAPESFLKRANHSSSQTLSKMLPGEVLSYLKRKQVLITGKFTSLSEHCVVTLPTKRKVLVFRKIIMVSTSPFGQYLYLVSQIN